MIIVYFAHSVLNRGGDKMILAHLNHLCAEGHRVTIRTAIIDTAFSVDPRIVVERLPGRAKAATLFSALLYQAKDADCVVASIVSTAVLLSVRNRRSMLYFAQDDNETAYESPFLRSLIRMLYLMAFSVFKIPAVAVSPVLARYLGNRYGARCTTVTNGIDTATFYPAPSPELLELKQHRKAILLYSREESRKGFDIACKVVERLIETSPVPFEIWVVGDDSALIDYPCRHFGQVAEEELRGILSSADLFLYPSRSEGFGLMVFEAFACRCPVVTTSAVGFVRHEEHALVVESHDASSFLEQTVRLLTDDALAKRIADKAHAHAHAFTQSVSSAAFAAEIDRLYGTAG